MSTKKCCCECDECTGEGNWRIYILKEFWDEYGQICEAYCDFCLMEEIQGVHSGGGLSSSVIAKIERILDSEAVQLERAWHFPLKTLNKMLNIAIAKENDELAGKLMETASLGNYDKMNRWFGYYQKVGENLGYWTLDEVIAWVREERLAK